MPHKHRHHLHRKEDEAPRRRDTGLSRHGGPEAENPELAALKADVRYKSMVDRKGWTCYEVCRDRDIQEDYYLHHPKLGEGQFGTVVACFVRSRRKWTAVKALHDRVTDHSTLDSEVKILRRLWDKGGHKNIIKYEFTFRSPPYVYHAFELADGMSLFHLMESYEARRKIMSDEHVKRIMRGVLGGLEFLHLHGVVHRDMKPDNIVFGRDEVPKIIDFGGSVEITQIGVDEDWTTSGHVVGTLTYLAPESMDVVEQRRGHSFLVIPRQDVFSCGIILYQIEIGNAEGHPYRDKDPIGNAITSEYVQRQVTEMRRAAREKYNDTRVWKRMWGSSGARKLCKKMLHPEYLQRYTSSQAYRDTWLWE